MAAAAIVDHSFIPRTDPKAPISTASNLILIDNYDSFTWNVYQYLVLEGATVSVYRNDEITLEQLILKIPTQLVVSPGPGHPVSDAGVSNEAIRHFGGKIPILGVCLGEQCIYHVFGGRVDVTGEILHGKTSALQHDSKGMYAGLPQNLAVTRYHSLAGTHSTLPTCLEVSSWTVLGTGHGEGTVIMGVRHKELLVEGVQFHPESILTSHGQGMLRNFLKMRGGTWAENERLQQSSTASNANLPNGVATTKSTKSTILDKIYHHRRITVSEQMQKPSLRLEDLQSAYELGLAPPQISFRSRLRQSPYKLSLMAEIKRASPSKGDISLSTCAPTQARCYALAGASVISVLTEPEWFKGSIDDLRSVRQSLESMPNRPAVLRKEFIFDTYQILEARLAGADSVLLIVKMLEESTLRKLYLYSKSLGMEPLVEVNTVAEMEIAVNLGCKVIGVNNRNLTNFEVDLDTTSRLMSLVASDTIVCALSGISGPRDVAPYLQNGVDAVLVGEALMRASDTAKFVAELLGGIDQAVQTKQERNMLVKVCGTRTPEAAKAAIQAGADLIGIILVKGRTRCVTNETALAISQVVHDTSKPAARGDIGDPGDAKSDTAAIAQDYSVHTAHHHLSHPQRALLVGVFLDQCLDYVLHQQKLLSLDVIQFHGSEPLEWAKLVPVPVIKVFKPGDPNISVRGYHSTALLDSGAGGSGQMLDLSSVTETLKRDPQLVVSLAGGLTASNISEIVTKLGYQLNQVICFDVSSGVEENGQQSVAKIQEFVAAVKEP